MANYTPKQIASAIAAKLAAAAGQGVIVSDQKFAQSDSEWAKLVRGQADTDYWRGWVLIFLGIPTQVIDGDICHVATTYHFELRFFHFYLNDFGVITSADSFIAAIFAANEVLNADRTLGLGPQIVEHQFLQSSEDFGFADVGGGSADQRSHAAVFSFDVSVSNFYTHED